MNLLQHLRRFWLLPALLAISVLLSLWACANPLLLKKSSVETISSAAVPITSPDQVAGLAGWFRVEDTNTTLFTTYSPDVLAASGESISFWSNHLGGTEWFQSSVSGRPIFNTNRANGHGALTFVGSDDWMEYRNTSEGSSWLQGVSSTLFIVCSNGLPQAGTDRALFSNSTNGNMQIGFHGTNQNYVYSDQIGQIYPGFTNDNFRRHVFVSQITTSSNRLLINHSSSSWVTNPVSSYFQNELVGSAGGFSGADVQIWEVLWYTNSLTEANRTAVTDLLISRYSITP